MSKAVVVDDLIDNLPFHEALTWEKFQSFCTDLLYQRFNCIDSREYLLKGSNQQGIDVYATKKGETQLTVAQCKLKEYLGPKEVLGIVDKFLKSDLLSDTNEFILCTSADLGRQRDEEETITEARQKLVAHGINFKVWDQRGLSTELRRATPELINITYRYFDEGIALRFFGEIWKEYLKKLRTVKKHRYDFPDDYIERNITSYAKLINSPEMKDWNLFHEEPKASLINLFEENVGKNSKKVILLSTAGFGKTQELKRLAYHFSNETSTIYPIKFSLRDYQNQPIESILASYDPEWRNIANENILLLFDGLDEIGDQSYMPPLSEELALRS